MTKNVPNAPAVEFARWELEIAVRHPRPRGFPKKALGGIAAVVMAPSAARKPPGKGKTPKPDLRKRKTGKKKDEDGNPDAEPKETAEVRLVETRAAPAPT